MSNTHNEIHLLNSDGSTTPYGSTGGGGGGGDFTAFIAVSYPDGCDCVCTGMGESYTASDNPYTFTITKKGAYNVTVSKGSYTKTVQKTMTTDGATENVSIASLDVDGSTVTPINDVTTWLYCGDIYNKNYTTLSAVLADNATLVKVMASSNAADYLLRSTSWISDITASEAAMEAIGASDYASDTLLADSTWNTAILNSTYFEGVLNTKVPTMTSNTTPSGVASASSAYATGYEAWNAFDGDDEGKIDKGWLSTQNTSSGYLQYEFANAIKPYCFKLRPFSNNAPNCRTKEFVMQGSNDSTFTNISEAQTLATHTPATTLVRVLATDNSPVKKIRLNITATDDTLVGCNMLQIYGRSIGGVQDWLKAAGITNKSYTTLSEVLADSTTLAALMASEDAVDYLVTATAWASDITADQTAMSLIGLNNYATNTLLADNTWLEAIANSSYMESVLNVKVPVMTSNTTPSGEVSSSSVYGDGAYANLLPWHLFDNVSGSSTGWVANANDGNWVQYKFTKPVRILAAYMDNYTARSILNGVISASNDGSNFTSLKTGIALPNGTKHIDILSNNNTYQYYRLTINHDPSSTSPPGLNNLQFYGREDI